MIFTIVREFTLVLTKGTTILSLILSDVKSILWEFGRKEPGYFPSSLRMIEPGILGDRTMHTYMLRLRKTDFIPF